MADDARLSTALPRHPKTVKLKRRLSGDGCWSLVCLFLWVADNRCDGNLEGLSTEDIEIASDWSGDAGVFVASLSEVGFLDGDDGKFSIHDWAEHNPYAASKGMRVEAARNAARKRWGCDQHADGMPSAQKGNAHHHTTPHPTPQTKDRTFELPVWVPERPWNDYLMMREKLRKPPTTRAKELVVIELEKLLNQGHDPAEVLNQSTKKSYLDVYPVEKNSGANRQNQPTRVSAAAARNERNADAIANVARKIGIDTSMASVGGSPVQRGTDGGGRRLLASDPIVIPPKSNRDIV
jgi:hypothetical protein